jgi:hypothetical protein
MEVHLLASRAPARSREARWLGLGLDAAARIRDAVSRLSRIVRVESTKPEAGSPPILDTQRLSAPAADPPPRDTG